MAEATVRRDEDGGLFFGGSVGSIPASAPPSGGSSSGGGSGEAEEPQHGVMAVVSIKEFRVASQYLILTLGTAHSITGVAGPDITAQIKLQSATLVSNVSYNELSPSFIKTSKDVTVFEEGAGTAAQIVELVSHASQHEDE